MVSNIVDYLFDVAWKTTKNCTHIPICFLTVTFLRNVLIEMFENRMLSKKFEIVKKRSNFKGLFTQTVE